VEVYKGKVIFHGINHLLMWVRLPKEHYDSPAARLMRERHGDDYLRVDPESANPFPPDSNLTMIVRARLTRAGVEEVGFIPCVIDPPHQRAASRPFPATADLSRSCSMRGPPPNGRGRNAVFEVDGDFVRIRT